MPDTKRNFPYSGKPDDPAAERVDRLEGPQPRFTRGELELIHEAFMQPGLTFPAKRGHDAAGVLEKSARALGSDE